MQWASTHRTDTHRIWVHAASVGEYLTAEPVAQRLRQAEGVGQVVCSFSSPSMAGWPDQTWADAVDYIPLDEHRSVTQALGAILPSLVIFSRGDLWPEFVHGVKRLAIPLAVIGGTISRASKYHWLPESSAVRSVFSQLDWVGTNSVADRARWKRAGALESRIEITGDPRHDQIIERTVQYSRMRQLEAWATANPLFVAGSTNQEDEQLVSQAFQRILYDYPRARLVIVPHERSPGHVQRIARELRRRGISNQVWRDGSLDSATPCVVVTKMGILADLYALADVAYIGGGFRRGGLHAVAEPAAYAIPVITGPRYRDSADAEQMVKAGGAVALDSRRPVDSLIRHWKGWLDNVEHRWKCGLNARRTLSEGAANRTVRALLHLVPELRER